MAWLADPGRPASVAFLEQAGSRWPVETRVRDASWSTGCSSVRGRLDKIIATHTNQPVEKVAKDTERDYFMSAEEAKEYSIIDRVWRAPS